MKRLWEGKALGCDCAIEFDDNGKLRVIRVDGALPHEIPDYADIVIRDVFTRVTQRLATLETAANGIVAAQERHVRVGLGVEPGNEIETASERSGLIYELRDLLKAKP